MNNKIKFLIGMIISLIIAAVVIIIMMIARNNNNINKNENNKIATNQSEDNIDNNIDNETETKQNEANIVMNDNYNTNSVNETKNNEIFIDKDYRFDEENITKDGEKEFVSNEIIISFKEDVKSERCREIMDEINERVIFQSQNTYAIQTKQKFEKYIQIEEYCNKLKENYEEIKYAQPNNVVKLY